MAAISNIVTVLPEKRLEVAAVAERERLSGPDLAVVEQLGVAAVRDADGRSATDLAVEATRLLLADGDAARAGAFLLVGGRYPQALMASEATRAQRDSGLTSAFALGVSELGCVSVSAALLTGRGLLAADAALPGVVVAHGCTPPGPRRYRRPVTLNGDGAMALHLSQDGPLRILDMTLETNGEYWDLFQVDYLGQSFDAWTEVCRDTRRYSFSLAVETRKRFGRMNDDMLARQGLAIEDVDHFVTQNLSSGSFDFYEQNFDISIARACRRNLREYGHVGSSDIGLNLRAGMDDGEFQPGDLVLVMNSAPVAAWSSMLIEVTGPLPEMPAA
ncbi:3-oxoacyl-[acyl-carrier-protein] synthase III C-terminal domain-containing protein [Streptantibioticus silvisoli]|jgi:3-oxoacyl-[acyl-carrier-protein] synthase-3|uniref:3-oxoacyl-[acyl-carrier-protein] synthase III C-terminal domain-containing protein n=1 Tax=Streptantibioticus silvisoli TaxID=2705255 RepID=A0ABT6W6I5_9ACTN|nr:3-oxoacyl-[acyl-carrier-protein] synthase III C-terminal domain-containing protein [Streptantibioticus silvisoli]MDI5966361.1 3-oxoacyl-[acyl-carrier-protein] synthase III C-terminal domain-containing protein [Streptantibioticus silvisoli]